MSLIASCSTIFIATGAAPSAQALGSSLPGAAVRSDQCSAGQFTRPRRIPMNVMAPTRPTELRGCRIRLTTGPAASAEARRQVRAAICAWEIPVDPDVAILLTSELVTNAIRHEVTGIVMLTITCSGGQLRVDVHDTSRCLPMLVDASADDEAGRGLMLVTTLSDEWGFYRTPAGKAVYFTLAFQPDVAEGNGRGPQGVHAWGL